MQKDDHASGVMDFDLLQWPEAPKQLWSPVYICACVHTHTERELKGSTQK